MNELRFKSNGDGTCQLVVGKSFAETVLYVPEKSPEGDEVTSVYVYICNSIKKIFLPATFKFEERNFFGMDELEDITVDSDNPYFSSFEGVLFDKGMTKLIRCPPRKSGKLVVPKSVRTVAKDALDNFNYCLEEIIFQEGLQRTEQYSLYGAKIVTLPKSLTDIDKETFEGFSEYMWRKPTIRAPKNSIAHRFALKHGHKFMPSDCPLTWDAEAWLKNFRAEGADYRALRREVWENTRAIVEDNGYTLSNGDSILLTGAKRYSQFFYKEFTASFEWQNDPPEITVVPDDCLDVAHKWFNKGLEVAVLNMASRRNPGGGVTTGAGAQEEYLFRCSDYYKFLYRYAPYAEQYGVTRSHYQYPLEQNFGGIFSGGVTVFRENEEAGYCLLPKPWKVNMIAVSGMNSPRTIFENGAERIAPELIDGVKNKIRTIFRIACDRGQKNLVLGALGCGAFHNPPKHVAELFRDVLCEEEFSGAFKKICFAVKTSHTSKGDTNFSAFQKTLDGFIPTVKTITPCTEITIKKIALARGYYALLKTNGQVQIIDVHKGKSYYYRCFRKIIDISAGDNFLIGLREDGKVVSKDFASQDSDFCYIKNWCDGIAVVACQMHSAMLRANGTVLCIDYPNESTSGYPPTPEYSREVESWRNIKQVALTYEEPFALTRDGKFLCRHEEINDFFNACGKRIVQIDAWGCYWANHTVAALYDDGTVKAYELFYGPLNEVESWSNVKKICCDNDATVIALTSDGRVLISENGKYKDSFGNDVNMLENVIDITASFRCLMVLSSTGKIFIH